MGKTNNDAKKKEKASTSPPTSPKKWKANWSPGSCILSTDVRGKVREQNLDLVQTQVEGVYIGFCSKSWTNGESSYIFPMEKGLNDKEAGVNLSKEWRYVFGFLPRRDLSINDGITAMKAKRGSKWVWKVAVVVINDDSSVDKVGRHIANCFSNFTKNKDIMDTPEKYTYRRCNNNDPRALNHYLLDMDVAKILKSLGGYATKEKLIQDEEVLSAFYGTSEYGKFYLAVDPLVLEESAIVSETDAALHSSDDDGGDEGLNNDTNHWLSSNHIIRNRYNSDHMLSTQTAAATYSASTQQNHDDNDDENDDDDDDENDDSVDENEMKENAGPEDFYCSNLDDEDEAYVYKHLRSGREETVYILKRQQQQNDEEQQQQQQQNDNASSSFDGASMDNSSDQSSNNNLEDGGETSPKKDQHQRQQQPSTTNNSQSNNNNDVLYQARLLKPRTSDAILSCPRCFNVVCMDCQQHERYSNQYRAMFVMNIGVDWTKKMMYDDAIGGLKAFNSNIGGASGGISGEGTTLGGILEHDDDDDDASMPDRIPHDDILQSSNNTAGSMAKEVYYSVHCSYCRLELAALDMDDEIYYFFGCIASS